MAKKSRKNRKESKVTNVPAITLLRPKLANWLKSEEILQASELELNKGN